jgi:hypothetical protein
MEMAHDLRSISGKVLDRDILHRARPTTPGAGFGPA